MNQTPRTNLDDVTPSLSPFDLLLILLAVAGGALAAAVVLPTWMPGLMQSLLGDQPKAYWYMARASGFVAFIMIWLSVALGLIITNRMARLWNNGPTVMDLHQFTTWLSIAMALFHALILLGDRYIQSTVVQVLTPFGYANYKPEWVGIGQIAFYLTIVVAVSFYFRKQLGYKAWRKLHYVSFLVYVLIVLHGILAGTDTPSLMWVYIASGAATYFLTMYRIIQTIKVPTPARHAAAPAGAAAAPARPTSPAQATPATARPTPPAQPAPATPRSTPPLPQGAPSRAAVE
ncbi:MAG: ferric reductase-like transmembrane domain-containing protein [Anaerolineae bacterium]